MFEGFRSEHITLRNGLSIHARSGGAGPAVLLLHGYPQTSACWHVIAPKFVAAGFSVIAPDLRGYGASDKPVSSADHGTYSKRAMAADQIELMRHFGHGCFSVAGHDRGGRVAHRLALDHPDCVNRVAVLDIAPTAITRAPTATLRRDIITGSSWSNRLPSRRSSSAPIPISTSRASSRPGAKAAWRSMLALPWRNIVVRFASQPASRPHARTIVPPRASTSLTIPPMGINA